MTQLRFTRRGFLAASLLAASPLAGQGMPILSPSRTLQLPADSKTREPAVVTAVAVSPDGQMLAAAGDDHLVHLFSLAEGRLQQSLRGHSDWIRSLSFSRDGARLASGGDDHRVCLWEIPSGRLAKKVGASDRAIYCVKYSPDGQRLATVGFDRQLKLYDSAGDLSTVLACPGADMRAVAFSSDGSLLATAGRSGQVRVWDVSAQNIVFDRNIQEPRIRTLAFASDASHLAVAGDMQQVVFLDCRNGQTLGTIPNPAGRIHAMVYTAPHILATGASDNSIQLWDVTSGREERRLGGHHGSVTALAFEPRSGLLVSGSYDTTVRVWQLGGEGAQTALKPTSHGSRYGGR